MYENGSIFAVHSIPHIQPSAYAYRPQRRDGAVISVCLHCPVAMPPNAVVVATLYILMADSHSIYTPCIIGATIPLFAILRQSYGSVSASAYKSAVGYGKMMADFVFVVHNDIIQAKTPFYSVHTKKYAKKSLKIPDMVLNFF
jgi:hypothetical protein